MKKRRTFTPEQKTQIVLELLSEEHTLTEVAAKYEIQPTQITRWKSEFLKNATRAFSKEKDESDELKQKHASEIDELHLQLGQLTVEVNWLKKKSKEVGLPLNRRKLVEKSNPKLSIVKQCKLLELNRSTLYYQPKPVDRTEEYKVKWIIDQLYTAHPTYGYRTMTTVLRRDFGIKINKKRTRRYMRDMAIHGLCPGPNLSKREHAKYVYPYLLRKLHIDSPNQVWSIDITYLRMPKGHMYLFKRAPSKLNELIYDTKKLYMESKIIVHDSNLLEAFKN